MTVLIVIVVAMMLYVSRNVAHQTIEAQQQILIALAKDVSSLEKEKERASQHRQKAEQASSEIFTLYELTKEINKKLYEQEAFEVFRSTLEKRISFEDCRLIQARGDRRKEIPSGEDYLILSLKGGKQELGHLAIKGLASADQEKFVILAQQFAFALERIKLYQEVEKTAVTDSLTGVHTRRSLLGRLEEEILRSESKKSTLSFLMIDVDYFKRFNDKYGHLAGDQVLRSVSSLIKENIREIDFAGRYGGEEFSVVLPDTDSEGALYVAQRIRKAIEESSIEAYDATVRVTVSIGIASFPLDGKSSMEIVDKSDWALYRSKKRGRNCVTAFGIYKENV
jgi:diguanylate cyclase (GGDEF)-like protein